LINEIKKIQIMHKRSVALFISLFVSFTFGALAGPYEDGIAAGVRGDVVSLERFMRLAAEQGNSDAQERLGLIFYYGQGVAKDFIEAEKWYRRAAEGGVVSSQYSLALMHETGQGISVNYKEAFKWYRTAAQQGYAEAQYKLGIIYSEGKTVPQVLSLIHS
jgi:TPR repeat protein